jgi:hypothetical protein
MNPTLPRFTVLVVLLFTASAQAEKSAATPLTLAAGHSTVLMVAGLQRLAIADPEVLDVVPKGHTAIEVVGLKPGQSEFSVGTARGWRTWRVTVGPADATSTPRISTKIRSSKAAAQP